MKIEILGKEALSSLYNAELVYDFPKSELKPLRAMLGLMDMGKYEPLLVTEGGQPMGYAMMWLPDDRRGALLEYFGVLRGKRDRGYGSRILELLAERYGSLIAEAEAPTSDDPEENELRRRRLAFYQRNGFRVLDYECALFGVCFSCLYRGVESNDREVEKMHRGVYKDYFSAHHLERFIQLPLKKGEKILPAPEWVEEDCE